MQEPTNISKDLFVNSDQGAADYYPGIYQLSKYLFAVAIITSVTGLLFFVPNWKHIRINLTQDLVSKVGLQTIASLAYTVLFSILFPCQVFYYYRFAKASHKQNTLPAAPAGCHPLRYLLINAKISCVTFTANLLYFLNYLCTELWM